MQNTSYKIFFHKLNIWHDPEQVFVHLYENEQYAFWLDSSNVDPETSRFSYMGDTKGPLSKRIKYSATDRLLYITEKGETKRVKKNIFEYLEEQLKKEPEGPKEPEGYPFKFSGGFVGYFGYEVQGNTPYKSNLPAGRQGFPDAYFFFADRVIVFDHLEEKVYLVCITPREEEAKEWFDTIKSKIKNLPDKAKSWQADQKSKIIEENIRSNQNNKVIFTLVRNYRQYLDDIRKCKEYLKKGESYQICLTNTFSAEVQVDWLQLYLTLRKMNPAPYSAYLRFGDFAVLSSSPEKFLTITPDGFVETKPIKGTRPRGKTKQEDQQFIKELTTSKKDWSENAMIVDLLRNDLGKVCDFGSVNVKKFLAVETYQTVHQLVSTIRGKLRDDMTVIDCVKACFPGGSMTGVPKKRTMEILSKLEKNPPLRPAERDSAGQGRGIYSGALGFFSLPAGRQGLHGATELSIIIRTIIATKNQLTIGSGGAILIDSDPEKEYDEMLLKAKVLMEAVARAVRNHENVTTLF